MSLYGGSGGFSFCPTKLSTNVYPSSTSVPITCSEFLLYSSFLIIGLPLVVLKSLPVPFFSCTDSLDFLFFPQCLRFSFYTRVPFLPIVWFTIYSPLLSSPFSQTVQNVTTSVTTVDFIKITSLLFHLLYVHSPFSEQSPIYPTICPPFVL